ncbi:MAG: FHA domain-containing protein [Firmicutes bacterium]|nr:FHA domain-containing protein [Bacillota bacterium]
MEVLLSLFKYLFVIFLYIFLIDVLRTIKRDLAKQQETKVPVPAHLNVISGAGKLPGISGTLVISGETLIGRSDECHVKIDDPFVSSKHARIYRKGKNFYIEDMGSRNGIYLNGSLIRKPALIEDGDEIMIQDVQLVFHY